MFSFPILFAIVVLVATMLTSAPADARHGHHHHRHHAHHAQPVVDANGNRTYPGLRSPEVARKLDEIAGACSGFRIVSIRNHSHFVARTRTVSLHTIGLAADFAVDDYSCANRHLAGWPGGMSRDPGVVGHIHISYAPGHREFGVQFCHRATPPAAPAPAMPVAVVTMPAGAGSPDVGLPTTPVPTFGSAGRISCAKSHA